MTDSVRITTAVTLDGLPLLVDDRTDTLLRGRSLVGGGLTPLGGGFQQNTAGAFEEAAASGWHRRSIEEQLKWFALEPEERAALAVNREEIEGPGGDLLRFGSDPDLLRPPWPLDLVHVPPTENRRDPFLGPRAARFWLGAMLVKPVGEVQSFYVGETVYGRESLDSMRNVGRFSLLPITTMEALGGRAVISDSVMNVGMHLKSHDRHGRPLGGSQFLHYLVPLRSVCEVSFSGRWSTIKPWVGRDKAIVEARGYSPLNEATIVVTFSDGWRVTRLALAYDRDDQPGIDESQVLGLVRALIDSTSRCQRTDRSSTNIPLPDPRVEGNELHVDKELKVEFPDAVHFGVPIPASWSSDDAGPSEPRGAPQPETSSPRPVSTQTSTPTEAATPKQEAVAPTDARQGAETNGERLGGAGGSRPSTRVPPPPSAPPPPTGEDGSLAGEVAELAVTGAQGCLVWLAPIVGLLVLSWIFAALGLVGPSIAMWFFIPAVFLLRGRLEDLLFNVERSKIAGQNRENADQFGFMMESARNAFWLAVGAGFAVIGTLILLGSMLG